MGNNEKDDSYVGGAALRDGGRRCRPRHCRHVGEQQRVAIARALVNHPAILFADEPTANLDTSSGEVILSLLKKFNREHGQTIIMVSHEPEHTRYFDRIFWMRDGKLERTEERRKG